MDYVIYKYEFVVDDMVIINMPTVVKILAVGTQKPNHICIWAVVAPGTEEKKHTFLVRGTGHLLAGANVDYFIGTVFDGPYVWHVFRG